MTDYRLTLVARRDLETLVRSLARDDVRAAERAVDELCATMEWLTGTPDVGQLRTDLVADEPAVGGASRVRLWELRDWLLVYRDAATGAPGDEPPVEGQIEPNTFLRVLETHRPRWA